MLQQKVSVCVIYEWARALKMSLTIQLEDSLEHLNQWIGLEEYVQRSPVLTTWSPDKVSKFHFHTWPKNLERKFVTMTKHISSEEDRKDVAELHSRISWKKKIVAFR